MDQSRPRVDIRRSGAGLDKFGYRNRFVLSAAFVRDLAISVPVIENSWTMARTHIAHVLQLG